MSGIQLKITKYAWQGVEMSIKAYRRGRLKFFLEMRKNTRNAWQLAGMYNINNKNIFYLAATILRLTKIIFLTGYSF